MKNTTLPMKTANGFEVMVLNEQTPVVLIEARRSQSVEIAGKKKIYMEDMVGTISQHNT